MNLSSERSELIKSLGKGLSVLIAVNELSPVKVAKLVTETDLPKPTLIRILNTLVAEGFVAKLPRTEGGGYSPTPKVRRLSSAFAQGSLLSQISQRLMNNLSEAIKWPTDLMVQDGFSMVIESSTRHVSPITLQYFDQRRFPILTSAAGRVFLAHLPVDEYQKTLREALFAAGETEAFQVAQERVDVWVREARIKGYSYRDYDSPIRGTRAYAVPVMLKGYPVAVIVQPSLRDVLSQKNFEDIILPQLKKTAEEIAKELSFHSK